MKDILLGPEGNTREEVCLGWCWIVLETVPWDRRIQENRSREEVVVEGERVREGLTL